MAVERNNMLILIDPHTKVYKRYSGRTCVLRIKVEENLDAHWVELLRIRPEEILPPEEPELA